MTTAVPNPYESRARARKAYQLAADFRIWCLRNVGMPLEAPERSAMVAALAERAGADVWHFVAEHYGTRRPSAATIAAAVALLAAHAERVALLASMEVAS